MDEPERAAEQPPSDSAFVAWAQARAVPLSIPRHDDNYDDLSFIAEVIGGKRIIAVGESAPDPKLNPEELAAWTMVANLVLNLDEVVNKK